MHYVRACEPCYLHKFIDPNLHERSDEEDIDENFDMEEEEATPTPSTSSASASKRRRESVLNI